MKKERPGTCKTTKKERRKKLAKFSHRMHHLFGPTTVHGFGEGSELKCDICGIKTEHAIYKDGKWRCNNCG